MSKMERKSIRTITEKKERLAHLKFTIEYEASITEGEYEIFLRTPSRIYLKMIHFDVFCNKRNVGGTVFDLEFDKAHVKGYPESMARDYERIITSFVSEHLENTISLAARHVIKDAIHVQYIDGSTLSQASLNYHLKMREWGEIKRLKERFGKSEEIAVPIFKRRRGAPQKVNSWEIKNILERYNEIHHAFQIVKRFHDKAYKEYYRTRHNATRKEWQIKWGITAREIYEWLPSDIAEHFARKEKNMAAEIARIVVANEFGISAGYLERRILPQARKATTGKGRIKRLQNNVRQK